MLRQLYEPLWGLILPELCPRCESRTNAGFCTLCRDDFAPNHDACTICGLGPRVDGAAECRAHTVVWQTDAVLAPFVLRPPLEHYIYGLKFAGRRNFGHACGQLLAQHAFARRSHIDALVSVPLHTERLLQRGYNQALEIARSVSHELRLPILRSGVIRARATPPQTSLNAEARLTNLRSAFVVRRDLRGLRLAIIDDVITTGATVNALALSLRGAGAVHIEAWAVARTPR